MAGIKTIPLQCALKEHYYEYDYQKSIFVRGSLRYSKWSCFVRNDYASALKLVLGLACTSTYTVAVLLLAPGKIELQKSNTICFSCNNSILSSRSWGWENRQQTWRICDAWFCHNGERQELRSLHQNKIHVPILIIYNIHVPGRQLQKIFIILCPILPTHPICFYHHVIFS